MELLENGIIRKWNYWKMELLENIIIGNNIKWNWRMLLKKLENGIEFIGKWKEKH